MNLPWSKTLIIIPTFNEALNVKEMIELVYSLYSDVNILIVDDNSPDGTADIVKELQSKFCDLSLMVRKDKRGLGSAYLDGFLWAIDHGFDYVFEMDCDFTHDPKTLATMLELAQVSDVVIGSRYLDGTRIKNWSLFRKLISYSASSYVKLVTQIPLTDPTAGLKCFSRAALEKIDLSRVISTGYIFQLELNYRAWKKGLVIKETPITLFDRIHGESKIGPSVYIEGVLNVLKLKIYDLLGRL
ncbi:polyprenol monophosphomannose synthase [Halobacteriovorax sp.]|uniref:polyprenol monophosphomannose synthase n=1 Tax=Halobacteriovorax sp. TaxID=2020862 RepID=UPI003AF2D49B